MNYSNKNRKDILKGGGSEIRNVILLGVDCLRYCFLRKGGNPLNLCPTLNDLADKGIICSNAYSPSFPTQLSYPGVFTSTLPLDFGGYDSGISGRPLTIAEALSKEGLHTVGFSSSPWLGRLFGYDRGFSEFYEFFDINLIWCTFVDIYQKYYAGLLGKGVLGEAEYNSKVGDLFERFLGGLLRICEEKKNEVMVNRFPFNASVHRHDFGLYESVLNRIHTEFLNNPEQYVANNLSGDISNSIKEILTGTRETLDQNNILTSLLKSGVRLLRRFGIRYRDYRYSVSASYLRKQIESAISDNRDSGFFIWSHFLDIHDRIPIGGKIGWPSGFVTLGVQRAFSRRNSTRSTHAFCLRLVDRQIERIIARLKRENLLESTLLVIYGDHGFPVKCPENIAGCLFNEATRVPMVFYNPGLKHRTISAPCSLLDIGPTVLSLLGGSVCEEFKGTSLTGELDPDRCIILESLGPGPGDFCYKAIKMSVIRGGYKLIWRESGYKDSCPDGANYLFNLEADPDETTNLYEDSRYATVVSDLESIAIDRCVELRKTPPS